MNEQPDDEDAEDSEDVQEAVAQETCLRLRRVTQLTIWLKDYSIDLEIREKCGIVD